MIIRSWSWKRNSKRHTSSICLASFVDSTFSTLSTAAAVCWFWNLSKIVAAVKSTINLEMKIASAPIFNVNEEKITNL